MRNLFFCLTLSILFFTISCGGGDDDSTYTDNRDNTITDSLTDLMWQKVDDDTTRTWADAGTYCDELTLAGHSDWRLPNFDDLTSIVDDTRTDPSINTTYFPYTNSAVYWSSTDYYILGSDFAWSVDFSDGEALGNGKSSNNGYARCVRLG